ncbi:Esterase lipase thioesterase active site [Spiromyces aspiralis]|uniref:Esterase lipase thioesterase active site n=1 Tax=Spiromyces aspiralis TaxID=68401 RepID=A0ACC1HUV7_9FUNG|nr:Esterase lipase thioesterase active site [Spiromyces aspiralis]
MSVPPPSNTSAKPNIAPYGSWKSPLRAADVAIASTSIVDPFIDPARPCYLYWVEGRPNEGGRKTILGKRISASGDTDSNNAVVEYTPAPWNVRTRVHEYGGAAYAVYDGLLVFSNWDDCGLYLLDTCASEKPVVPVRLGHGNNHYRYACIAIHPSKRFLLCVREDHSKVGDGGSANYPVNALVAVSISAACTDSRSQEVVLVDDYDFVSSPAINPEDTCEIAFFAWNHPDMSWDNTVLLKGRLNLDAASTIPIGLSDVSSVPIESNNASGQVSTLQPRFDTSGNLYFISDPENYWYPYTLEGDRVVACLPTTISADFASPEWVFGQQSFVPMRTRQRTLITSYVLDGKLNLIMIDVPAKSAVHLPPADWSNIAWLGTVLPEGQQQGNELLVVKAGSPARDFALYLYSISLKSVVSCLYNPNSSSLDRSFTSYPEEIVFPTNNLGKIGNEGDEMPLRAYAFYYPPTNPWYTAPEGTLPPLLVISHGGPSAATTGVFNPRIQYWTSRGFAVVDVNYGGSTGYGREYRERIYPQFGIIDVNDCCCAALYLVSKDLVDRNKLSIMGSSSGGYTTLASLTFRPEVFRAGASLYGISDLELLAKETHKFESHYTTKLIGPYPEQKSVYAERSPIHYADNMACPVIFFQGNEDKIVPPSQALVMVNALKGKGLPVSYIEFKGEQHGFSKAENIIQCLEAQFWFFGKIFGYVPADDIAPVEIIGLKL